MALVWLLSLALVGASSAFLQAYPSIVQVETLQPWGYFEQSCAASILNTRNVLSAASCFTASPSLYRIRAGAERRHTGGIINYVERVNNYPRGNSTDLPAGDISVVRLASPLSYNPLIQRTPIPTPQTYIPNGLTLAQGGWGRGNFSSSLSVSLVRTVSGNHCGINLPTNQTTFNSTANLLCGTLISGLNSTNTDGGSPWFFGNITVGVVSGLDYGNTSWSHIVATPVASFTNWIIRTAV
ncbi:trypsin, alkaline A-like [Nymphalis io]|uniref:trypsin, alkaline A-like n=1 Tax=Inachis io TaxID=171585 RepID=UPI0021678143|nr:trypsin, alkaline A-like [Nymphalis io]